MGIEVWIAEKIGWGIGAAYRKTKEYLDKERQEQEALKNHAQLFYEPSHRWVSLCHENWSYDADSVKMDKNDKTLTVFVKLDDPEGFSLGLAKFYYSPEMVAVQLLESVYYVISTKSYLNREYIKKPEIFPEGSPFHEIYSLFLKNFQ